jgi:hypothetical protein
MEMLDKLRRVLRLEKKLMGNEKLPKLLNYKPKGYGDAGRLKTRCQE